MYPSIERNAMCRLNIRGYHDLLPDEHIDYFRTDFPTDGKCGLLEVNTQNITFHEDRSNLPPLVIGIALYNEEPEELRRVLVSLADQVEEMKELVSCHVVLVSDGHKQMNPRTKTYLKALFCNTEYEESLFGALMVSLDEYCKEKELADEDERIGTAVETRKQPPPPLSYVIQRTKNGYRQNIRVRGAKDGNDQRFLRATLVLKSLNRRKHNSQSWMFNFTKNISDSQDTLLFLTDCGTMFEKGCILRLVAYMRENKLCVGCTGRQRVMTSEEQDCQDEGFIEKFFRLVQMADYEGSYAIYTGAFSLIGCLPVLPGPCVMLRFSALNEKRLFREKDPLEDVLLGERRQIMYESYEEQETDSGPSFEDDIEANYSSVTLVKAVPTQETALNHFDKIVEIDPSETSLPIENVKLAEDRIPSYAIITHGKPGSYTTWVNGAVFKFQAETGMESFVKQRRRWLNGAMFSYVWTVFIRPDLICGSSHNIFRRLAIWTMFFIQLLTYGLAAISPSIFTAGLYLGLISLFEGNGQIYILITTVLFSLYTYFFIWVHRYKSFVKPLFYLMMFINMIAMIMIVAGYIRQSAAWSFSPEGVDRIIIQWSTVFIMAAPFVMSLVALDLKSFLLLLKSCVPYWLFLPTMIGSFMLYSVARVFDVSWGNRGGSAGANFKSVTQKQLTEMSEDFSSNSLIGLICITLLNIVIEIIVIYFGVNSWFIIGCLGIIFSTTIFQILLSFCYFMIKHISGATFWQKYSCCLCCGRRVDFL